MKLQDYLPYYLGCDYWTNNSEGNLNANTLPHIIGMCEQDKGVQLHLRKVDSMSHEEWVKIKNELSAFLSLHGVNVAYKDKPYWVLILENRINTNTLLFNDGIVLMKYGYDVFGLIESGLAIDSKTLK